MSIKASFSLGRALSAAAGFVPRALGGAWLILLALWVATVGGHLAMMRFRDVAGHHGHVHAAHILLFIVLVLLKFAALGALYRIALFGKDAKKEGLGFGGVQLAMPEMRLFGANIAVALFICAIAVTQVIVFAMLFNLLGMGEGFDTTTQALRAMLERHTTPLDWAFILYMLGSVIFLVFVALKFVFVHAATVAERRLVTLNALGLSSGSVGKLFIGLVTICLPFAFIWIAMLHIFALQIRTAHLLPHAWPTYQLHFAFFGCALGLAIAVLFPLLVGFLASAYRQTAESRAK